MFGVQCVQQTHFSSIYKTIALARKSFFVFLYNFEDKIGRWYAGHFVSLSPQYDFGIFRHAWLDFQFFGFLNFTGCPAIFV